MLSLKYTIAVAFAFMALSAQAATLSVTPTTLSVTAGQTVTLTLRADAAGTKIYTVKGVVIYPADLLEPVSFTFMPGWLALSQPGYDQLGDGKVIKTAGVTGGFSDARSMGALVFTAKKSGIATIAVDGATAMYNKQNQNAVSGAQGSATVTIAAAIAKPPTSQILAPVSKPASEEKPTVLGIVAPQPTEEPASEPVQNPLLAAVGSIVTFGTGKAWLDILVGLIILAGIGYAINLFLQRRRKNQK